MQRRTTTYTCDRCGKDVAKRGDLVRFAVRAGDYRSDRNVAFDLCEQCEVQLIDALVFATNVADPTALSRRAKS